MIAVRLEAIDCLFSSILGRTGAGGMNMLKELLVKFDEYCGCGWILVCGKGGRK